MHTWVGRKPRYHYGVSLHFHALDRMRIGCFSTSVLLVGRVRLMHGVELSSLNPSSSCSARAFVLLHFLPQWSGWVVELGMFCGCVLVFCSHLMLNFWCIFFVLRSLLCFFVIFLFLLLLLFRWCQGGVLDLLWGMLFSSQSFFLSCRFSRKSRSCC
ncbi:hypothetical protein BDZ97DRAFT_832116 [Flammula alnicola]|nr:hypothetical protein BDZ97DRAFT_832116 [Flammula alnicola]